MSFQDRIEAYRAINSLAAVVFQSGLIIGGVLVILGFTQVYPKNLAIGVGILIIWTSLMTNLVLQQIEDVN